jgi:hypothetical protein
MTPPLVDQITGILTQVFLEGAKDRAFKPKEMERIARDIIDRVIGDEQYAIAAECPCGCDETRKALSEVDVRVKDLEKNIAGLTGIIHRLTENTYPHNGWLTYCSSKE